MNPWYPWGLLQVSSVDSEGVMVKCKDGSEPRVTGRTVIWARAPFPGAPENPCDAQLQACFALRLWQADLRLGWAAGLQ